MGGAVQGDMMASGVRGGRRYADPGLAESEDEIEKSKIIAAVERF